VTIIAVYLLSTVLNVGDIDCMINYV